MHSTRSLIVLAMTFALPCVAHGDGPVALGPNDSSGGPLFGLNSRVNGLAVSSDGQYLAVVAESGELVIWDIGDGEIQARTEHDGPLRAVALHGQRNLVAFAGTGSGIRVWDLDRDFRMTLQGSDAGTTALTYFGEGIAAGGADGTVRFFHPNFTGVMVGREKHRGPVTVLTSGVTHGTKALPFGSHVVVSADVGGMMRIWNDGNCVLRKRSGGNGIRFAQFASDNSAKLFMAVGSADRGRWLQIGLKDNYERYPKEYPALVTKTVSYKGTTRQVKQWGTKSVCAVRYTRTTPTLKDSPAGSGYKLSDTLALAPNGASIASAGAQSIEIWSLTEGSSQPTTREIFNIDEPVDSMIWSADGRRLFTASRSGKIRVMSAD